MTPMATAMSILVNGGIQQLHYPSTFGWVAGVARWGGRG
ncbi:hypothetical protein RIEGSTA812A_PEG_356 [invertebrate metagenome]|uniref:Uncharacterized protein n=1 Tax=invertebrate metagenome TaxID=1711999 RepID=A0A484H856_9ZZZZ